jgi:hypothetical protein
MVIRSFVNVYQEAVFLVVCDPSYERAVSDLD